MSLNRDLVFELKSLVEEYFLIYSGGSDSSVEHAKLFMNIATHTLLFCEHLNQLIFNLSNNSNERNAMNFCKELLYNTSTVLSLDRSQESYIELCKTLQQMYLKFPTQPN